MKDLKLLTESYQKFLNTEAGYQAGDDTSHFKGKYSSDINSILQIIRDRILKNDSNLYAEFEKAMENYDIERRVENHTLTTQIEDQFKHMVQWAFKDNPNKMKKMIKVLDIAFEKVWHNS